MKKQVLLAIALVLLLAIYSNIYAYAGMQQIDSTWKEGVARVKITPEQSMWMAGFAFRDRMFCNLYSLEFYAGIIGKMIDK